MELRPYQQLMIEHMQRVPRCSLWAGMGLGKTVSTLTALDQLSLVEEVWPVLVLAPLRVARTTWPEEVRKWAHLRHLKVAPIIGSERERLQALHGPRADIYTMNYENLPWLIDVLKRANRKWPFVTVVADESTRLKSFRLKQGGQRAQALGRVAFLPQVRRWVNLTGTPAPNGLADLWGQQWFVDRGQRLGASYSAFQERWFQRDHDGYGSAALPMAREQIEDVLRDVCLTIDPADWFDLDEPIVNNIYVDLPARARRAYREMEKEMFAQLTEEHGIEAFNAASRTVKCLQLANGAAYVGEGNTQWEVLHDEKIEALREVVEEAAGAPVLVAYHFKSDLARLAKALPMGRTLDANPATIRDWNAGKIPVLFAHPASAGHGLNLQDGGNILVFFGHWWSLEEYQQIIERIGPVRQKQAGHNRPVFIHHILARDTVDELVMARRETKREVQDLLLEAMKR